MESRLRQENEALKAEIRELEALRDSREDMQKVLAGVDHERQKRVDPAAERAFEAMQKEILELRARCDGYHHAFEEAQRKLARLRELYTLQVLPKLQAHVSHAAAVSPTKPARKTGKAASPPGYRGREVSHSPSHAAVARKPVAVRKPVR